MKILIFRIGSIGDTVVALPALHKIRSTFPQAEITLIENAPEHSKTKIRPVSEVIRNSGLVDGVLEYSAGPLKVHAIIGQLHSIRQYKPDILIYLMPTRTKRQLVRDWFFFKACGISWIVGLNFSSHLQVRLFNSNTGLWEHEAQRLARTLDLLGPVDLESPDSWDLRLSVDELQSAREALSPLGQRPFLAMSVGTKVDAKDWGEENWNRLTEQLARHYPAHGLVLVGSEDETERCDRLARHWSGPSLNLCGRLTPRVSAAVLGFAALFVGHDSGPMHLAAAAGTSVVAIFSARNKPGEWFPWGTRHRVLYNKTDCFGCRLDVCTEQGKKCIRGISVDAVVDAVLQTCPPEGVATS